MKSICYLLGYENFIPPTEFEDTPEVGVVISNILDMENVTQECINEFKIGYLEAEKNYKTNINYE